MIRNILFISFSLLRISNIWATITSVTDDSRYPQYCQNAADNTSLFAQFKNNPIYSGVMETVSYEQGKEYLEAIRKQSPELFDHLEAFKANDTLGNPPKFYYDGVGEISPTTLRYIKIASDIKRLFGSLDQCSIIEIGGGYGGQCKILADIFHFKKYTIIDLPGPLALAKRFLKELDVKNVYFLSPESVIPDQAFDLVIWDMHFRMHDKHATGNTFRMFSQFLVEDISFVITSLKMINYRIYSQIKWKL